MYEEYDKPRFEKVQEDISRHLLKMRITFTENDRMANTYRSDISFMKTNGVILIYKKD